MVSFDLSKILPILKELLAFIPTTLLILISAFLLGNVIGIFVAVGLNSKDSKYKNIAKTYVFIFRSTPSVVMIFLCYYGIPAFMEGWLKVDWYSWPPSVFVVIALSILFSVNMGIVYKSAFDSVADGQFEAGLASGLTKRQTFFRIILQQALIVALPNLGNSTISLLKNSAVAYTIGLFDVMGAGQIIISRNLGNYSLETYTAVAIIYWLITFFIMLAINFAEVAVDPKKGGK